MSEPIEDGLRGEEDALYTSGAAIPPAASNEPRAEVNDLPHTLPEQDVPLSPIVDSLLMAAQNSRSASRADSRSVKRVPKHMSTTESSIVQQPSLKESLSAPQVSGPPMTNYPGQFSQMTATTFRSFCKSSMVTFYPRNFLSLVSSKL